VHRICIIERFQASRAAGHFVEQLSARTWKKWWQFIEWKRSRLALLVLSDDWCKKQLLRRVLGRWVARHEGWQLRARNNMAALHFWKRQLEGRVWRAWVRDCHRRRHKAVRIAEATEWRRRMLLRGGVVPWLRYGLGRHSARVGASTQRQADMTREIWARVAKYAYFWRNKAVASRDHRYSGLSVLQWTLCTMHHTPTHHTPH
jgi:hypothetical protein